MSSQAERIKAFKLAQHARLQKQEEEEQWISSEELCTEGSSDEETHTNIKTSHRKLKRNPKSEKRGISPLAQPPQNSDILTYQQDSNYLLPNIHPLSKPDGKHNVTDRQQETHHEAGDSCPSSSQINISEHSIDAEEDLELEKLIQWRPKRGSIKLPDFPEGMTVDVVLDKFN